MSENILMLFYSLNVIEADISFLVDELTKNILPQAPFIHIYSFIYRGWLFRSK